MKNSNKILLIFTGLLINYSSRKKNIDKLCPAIPISLAEKTISLLLAFIFFSFLTYAQNLGLVSNSFTPSGTELIKYNGKLYFAGYESVNGTELWVSDGTSSGTNLFKNICPNMGSGSHSSNPSQFTVCNGLLFFVAYSGSTDKYQLWVTDGTVAGTHVVKVLYPLCGGANVEIMKCYNNSLIFNAQDVDFKRGLFKTDGTASGTVLIKKPFNSCNAPTMHNGELYFANADWPHTNIPEGIWKTDGTTAGTVLVTSYYPRRIFSYNNSLLLPNSEMYILNGASNSPSLLRDFYAAGADIPAEYLIMNYNGKVYYSSNTGNSGSSNRIIVTDGTSSGTNVFGNCGIPSRAFYEYQGNLHFGANNSNNTNNILYWTSDGTTAGTQILSSKCRPVSHYKNYHNRLHFIGFTNNYDKDHFVSEGTDASIHLIDSNKSLADPDWGDQSSKYIEYNGSLYFTESSPQNYGLYKYENTTPLNISKYVNQLVTNVSPNPTSSTINLELNNKEKSIFSLFDLLGKQVLEKELPNGKKHKIDITGVPSGSYIYSIKTSKETANGKIIIN